MKPISPPQEVRPEFLGSCLTSTRPLTNNERLIAWRFRKAKRQHSLMVRMYGAGLMGEFSLSPNDIEVSQ